MYIKNYRYLHNTKHLHNMIVQQLSYNTKAHKLTMPPNQIFKFKQSQRNLHNIHLEI